MAGGDRRFHRRDVLRAALAAGTAAGVASVAGQFPAGAASTKALGAGPGGAVLPPDTLPHPALPAGTDTLPQIEHIVVLMMENHSFDDHLGMLGRGDGLTPGPGGRPVNFNPDPSGGYVRSFHNPNTCGYADSGVSQSWDASHVSWDHGTNMGFVKACGPATMGYWTGEDLPFYYSLASQFPIGDRYFCSVMAQTFPNRRFLMGATALGNVATNGTGITGEPPNGTIFDRLDAHGISWKNYYPDAPSCALFLPVYQRNQHNGKVVHFEQFLADAASGNLPAFSMIDPYTNLSEEGGDISIGEAYAATMIEAVLHSPAWDKTALIWTYDEHGGWYDHVPPQPAIPPDNVPPAITVPPDQPGSYDMTGFRVPFAMVSPWSRRDYVSHQVAEHTSILKLVETKWNLPALTYRDANAHNLLDYFDFRARRPPFAEPPTLARPRNPFTGPLPAGSAHLSDFHPICSAVPTPPPPAGAHLAHPPTDALGLMAEHQRKALIGTR
ncbi:MAG TPA: alkaline phosphatase family protein [Acidimicrobiales bacterium]|nr:alkaline phosphatase family protein [Acidimicrobiales bacterium]